MRDYEMVELKLSVALQEGIAGRGLSPGSGRFSVERLMPGLYVLGVPVGGYSLSLVILTDEYDLSLLGIGSVKDRGLVLLHERDVEALAKHGIAVDTGRFTRRDPMPGWLFSTFPWKEAVEADLALQALFPAYQPNQLQAEVFADC